MAVFSFRRADACVLLDQRVLTSCPVSILLGGKAHSPKNGEKKEVAGKVGTGICCF